MDFPQNMILIIGQCRSVGKVENGRDVSGHDKAEQMRRAVREQNDGQEDAKHWPPLARGLLRGWLVLKIGSRFGNQRFLRAR